jgi:hypothetical protein
VGADDERIARAVELALRRVLTDDEIQRHFWERGFRELSSHTQNHASQWVGKRILTTMVVAVTTAGIVWLVKSGAIK